MGADLAREYHNSVPSFNNRWNSIDYLSSRRISLES